MRKKETLWLIGTLIFVLILNTLIFGIDGLKSNARIDINIHDTYYIIENVHFIMFPAVFIFFTIYLIRTLRHNFKNLTANLILMISTLLLILVFMGINSILEVFIQQTSGWTIHPPLSAGEIESTVQSEENNSTGLDILSNILFYTQIILLIFLTYCGFKTGRNYKPTE